ncbi:MAG: Hsp33 family molecular chaperone HslO [Deltaproteobacteria bacterium]|nr:Hsp33 family molecular chaperone HslO [Deltaproteobacteria bacterium]
MTDTIERVISKSGNFFGICCKTTTLVSTACRMHDVGPLAAVALGRALTGAALLAALLKDGQSVQLKFAGSGPLGKVITEAGYDGWVRGYVARPHADLPLKNGLIDVASGIGHAGFLTVTKNISGHQKYPGTIQLYTSEIGEDIAYYLTTSEQTPSVIALGMDLNRDGSVAAAGGFLIQSLPPAEEHSLLSIEQQISSLPSLAQLFDDENSPGTVLSTIFSNIPHKKTAAGELYYSCSCNRSKMQGALLSLGYEELSHLLQKEGKAEVRCEFCRDTYTFNRQELEAILATEPEKNQH